MTDSEKDNDSSFVRMQSVNKFSNRVLESTNECIRRRIEYLSKISYSVLAHKDHVARKDSSIFTLILLIYNTNETYVLESINSVFAQTYPDVEVILISNGTSGHIHDIIREAFSRNKNSKLIEVSEHLYDPSAEDFLDPIPNLWNAGLFCSEGDFVYFLSCDDKVSEDYVERMVQLFNDNPRCVSAAPMVLSINRHGDLNSERCHFYAEKNQRGRYTDGIVLAKSYMRRNDLICFPGGLLAQVSESVITHGGFDNMNDLSQIFKFAIHGESGFDPEAKLYWRHHEQQANKLQKKKGLIYYKNYMSYASRYDVYDTHISVGGKSFADEFKSFWQLSASSTVISSLTDSYTMYGYVSGMKALMRVLYECPPELIVHAMFRSLVLTTLLFIRQLPLGIRAISHMKAIRTRLSESKVRTTNLPRKQHR